MNSTNSIIDWAWSSVPSWKKEEALFAEDKFSVG